MLIADLFFFKWNKCVLIYLEFKFNYPMLNATFTSQNTGAEITTNK